MLNKYLYYTLFVSALVASVLVCTISYTADQKLQQYNALKTAILKKMKPDDKAFFEQEYPVPCIRAVESLADNVVMSDYTGNCGTNPTWVELKIDGESMRLTGMIAKVFIEKKIKNEQKEYPTPSSITSDFVDNNRG
jgi:hypothetical protein